jgi:hypothetical protein
MRIKLNHIIPGLAAAAIGGAIALAPIASADTDPLVPYGTNPQVPYVLGHHESNHDEADTTNGQLDLPFNPQRAQAECPAVPGRPELHGLQACFGLSYWPIDELDGVKNWDTVEVAP